jgi:hypothetical protein
MLRKEVTVSRGRGVPADPHAVFTSHGDHRTTVVLQDRLYGVVVRGGGDLSCASVAEQRFRGQGLTIVPSRSLGKGRWVSFF